MVKVIARNTLRNFAHLALILMALAIVGLYGAITDEKESVTRPAVDNSAKAFIEAYECSDDVEDPTHVVVTIDGVTEYLGQNMTDKAIEQTVFGIDHGIETIHAFCP